MDRAALSKLTKNDLIDLLLAQEACHAAEMAALLARVAELERRLGLNSSNCRRLTHGCSTLPDQLN